MNYSIALLFRKSPVVYLALALTAGVLTAVPFPAILVAILVFVVAIAVLFMASNDNLFTAALLLCVWAFGWAYHAYERERIHDKEQTVKLFQEQNVLGKGIVQELKTTLKGERISVKNMRMEADSFQLSIPIRYFVYSKKSIAAGVGDTIIFSGRYQVFGLPRNPGEFDFKTFYQRQNIFGRVYQNKEKPIRVIPAKGNSLLRMIHTVRDGIRNRFYRATDESVAGLLSALILGDKSEVDPELKSAFVETGVIHVLAVSGLHVGYVLLILMVLTKFLRIPWGWDRIAIITGLGLFVLLTGGRPSVVRASLMAVLYVLAPIVNRPVHGWNIIATAAFIILLANPTFISDLGFLLSFTAVISIIYFYGLFEKILPDRLRVSQIKNTYVKYTWGLFLVSLSAQIGTLPITVYYFHKIPIVALVANIIIVPLIGILVALGFAILFFGWIPGVGVAYGQSAWVVTKLISIAAEKFSAFPLASYPLPQINTLHIIQYGLLVFTIFSIFHRSGRRRAVISGLLIVNLVVWSWAFQHRGLNVIFLDVGQGDAAIVRFQDGKTMLVDAGLRRREKDMGRDVVFPVARYLGISRFNWVVMSHPHNDHIGGLVTIVEEIPIDTIWDTHVAYDSWTYDYLLKRIEQKGIPYRRPQSGDVIRINGQTMIQILAPDTAWIKNTNNVNDLSIVFRLKYGNTSVLFTGDLEMEGDGLLLPYESALDSDVLKVAHHGSITSTTQQLLEKVTPELAVISVGRRNKFHHPSPLVMKRLRENGAKIERTDKNGAIWLFSDGESFREVSWR